MDELIAIRPSARFLITRVVGALFIFDTIMAAILIFYLLSTPNAVNAETLLIIFLIVHTVRFFAGALLIVDSLVRFLDKRYYVTKHHLVVHSGILRDDERLHELGQLRKLHLYQSWLGRRMNYGTILIEISAPSYDETLSLINITEPKKVAKMLEKHLA